MSDERELVEGQMAETSSSSTISTKQDEIAALAGIEPRRVLTTLAHRIDLEWMREAYRRTRKDGAVGVDAVDRKAFEADLDDNLASLLDGLKSGRYRAPPVRRVHIDKDGGKATRPIGIPTLGDKVLQRAVAMALEPVYERDFLDCSYGFRPGRSAHDALERLRRGAMDFGGGWIIDLDIRGFFDNVDRTRLGEMLDGRVRDGSDPSRGGEVVERRGHGGRCGEAPGEGHAAGRGDQPAAGQYLPAQGARHLVREGRAAASSARRLHGALRRRRGAVLRGRGRRPSGDGGVAQAARALRPGVERAEDAVGGVRPAGVGRGSPLRGSHVRLPGVHPLLAALEDRALDREQEDVEGSVHAFAEIGERVVPEASSLVDR